LRREKARSDSAENAGRCSTWDRFDGHRRRGNRRATIGVLVLNISHALKAKLKLRERSPHTV